MLAAIGVRDLLVVVTEDAVLVSSREAAQDVKKVVERLKAGGSERHHAHVKVFRHKWMLAEALAEESEEWRFLPAELVNKIHNKELGKKLESLYSKFEVRP